VVSLSAESAPVLDHLRPPAADGPAATVAAALAPSVVLVVDMQLRVIHVEGDAFARHGMRTTGWSGRLLRELLPPDAAAVLLPRYRAALDGAPQFFDLVSHDATRTYQVQMAPVRDAQGAVSSVVAVMQDMTEHRRVASELARSEARLQEAERMVGVGSWELLHATGEITFSPGFARLLGMRDGERLDTDSHLERVQPDDRERIARFGAECVVAGSLSCEYGLMQPDGTVRTMSLHAESVRDERGQPHHLRGAVLDVTERKAREAQLELRVGDAVWLTRIRAALDEDRLMLYTQPIVDLTTGETVQNELLLRMRGEDGSVIAPGEFLPIAERYGLISEIDRWVVREAARIAATGTPTEFNLSARSVGDPDIIRELEGAIRDTGADPSLIVVEVTETALVGRTDVGGQFAEQIRGLGCRLALDDFGTGFSSLSFLKHLPADFLKIDIDFVRELAHSETDARVIRGIVGLAREFHQITIAEGVEDEHTLLRLKELGVDRAQGYLFARPAPHSDVPDVVAPDPAPASASGPHPVEIVRAWFEAFAARDLPAILALCRPDMVLRTYATSRMADRSAPYRGHDGLRTYMHDVSTAWDELRLIPLELRQTPESVIGFGRAEARRGADLLVASVVWVVRLQEGQVTLIEVFQAPPENESATEQPPNAAGGAVSS
jgi:PAS domain S-box-containing protein